MSSLFGKKLRNLREQKGITQEDLARHLGLKRQGHVSNLEMGRKAPSLDLVVQIADFFEVTTDYLIRDSIPLESNFSATSHTAKTSSSISITEST